MIAIIEDLGDEQANLRPEVVGANTSYVILSHCLGVIEYWAGDVVAGRQIERDRDAEFRASGPVALLVERTRVSQDRLRDDLASCEPTSPPRGAVRPKDADRPFRRTQGGVLMHIFEELAQHLGQMEGCRDVLRSPWAVLVPQT